MRLFLWGWVLLSLGSLGCLDSWPDLEKKSEPGTESRYKAPPTFQPDLKPPTEVKEADVTFENVYETVDQLEREVAWYEKAPLNATPQPENKEEATQER